MSSIHSKLGAAFLGSVLLAGCGEKEKPTSQDQPLIELRTPKHLDMVFELNFREAQKRGSTDIEENSFPSAKIWVNFDEQKKNQLESLALHLSSPGKYNIRLYDMIGGMGNPVYEQKDKTIVVSAATGSQLYEFDRTQWPGEIEFVDALLEIRFSPEINADKSNQNDAQKPAAHEGKDTKAAAKEPAHTKDKNVEAAAKQEPATEPAKEPAAAGNKAVEGGAVDPAAATDKTAEAAVKQEPATEPAKEPAAAGNKAVEGEAVEPATATDKTAEAAAKQEPATEPAKEPAAAGDKAADSAPAPAPLTPAGPEYGAEVVILLNLPDIAARAN